MTAEADVLELSDVAPAPAVIERAHDAQLHPSALGALPPPAADTDRALTDLDANRAAALLTEAAAMIAERGRAHGDVLGAFTLFAELLNREFSPARFGAPCLGTLTAIDALRIMALFKRARLAFSTGAALHDSRVDMLAYEALALALEGRRS